MQIIVTQDDINHGTGGSCHFCPVARAIERALPGSSPSVDPHTVLFNYGGLIRNPNPITLPQEVREFINNFDAGIPVEPFEFTLDYCNYCKGKCKGEHYVSPSTEDY